MNISFVGSSINTTAVVDSTKKQAQTPEQASERAKLIQAVKTVNESKALGDNNNELTFAVDRATHRTVIRIINRNTQDVVMQIPAEYVLRLAEQVKNNSSE
jgi:flagellar protein FlaG